MLQENFVTEVRNKVRTGKAELARVIFNGASTQLDVDLAFADMLSAAVNHDGDIDPNALHAYAKVINDLGTSNTVLFNETALGIAYDASVHAYRYYQCCSESPHVAPFVRAYRRRSDVVYIGASSRNIGPFLALQLFPIVKPDNPLAHMPELPFIHESLPGPCSVQPVTRLSQVLPRSLTLLSPLRWRVQAWMDNYLDDGLRRKSGPSKPNSRRTVRDDPFAQPV